MNALQTAGCDEPVARLPRRARLDRRLCKRRALLSTLDHSHATHHNPTRTPNTITRPSSKRALVPHVPAFDQPSVTTSTELNKVVFCKHRGGFDSAVNHTRTCTQPTASTVTDAHLLPLSLSLFGPSIFHVKQTRMAGFPLQHTATNLQRTYDAAFVERGDAKARTCSVRSWSLVC